jgi:hypothetical protein
MFGRGAFSVSSARPKFVVVDLERRWQVRGATFFGAMTKKAAALGAA